MESAGQVPGRATTGWGPGHCGTCGRRTHARRPGRRALWGRAWEPLTVLRAAAPRGADRDGDGGSPRESGSGYAVYKGYCVQPGCYTLRQAKELLGELQPTRRHVSAQHSCPAKSRPQRAMSMIAEPPARPIQNALVPNTSRALHRRQNQASGARRQMGHAMAEGTAAQIRLHQSNHCSPVIAKPSMTTLFLSRNGVDVMDRPLAIANVIKKHGDDERDGAHIACLGLKYLHAAVTANKGSAQDYSVVTTMILDQMQKHADCLDFIHRGIKLLEVLVESCKEHIVKEGGIPVLLTIISTNNKEAIILEHACQLLEPLLYEAATMQEEQPIDSLVTTFSRVVRSCTAKTRSSVLRSLKFLTQIEAGAEQFKKEEVSHKGLLSIAIDEATSAEIRAAVMYLVSKQVEASNEGLIRRPLVPERYIQRILHVWKLWNTPILAQTALDLIENSYSDASGTPKEVAMWLSSAEAALSSMRYFNNDEAVQVSAMRATLRITDNDRAEGPLASVLHSGSAVSLVQSTMDRFPDSADVAILGWQILMRLRESGDTAIPNTATIGLLREHILHESGLDQASKAQITSIFEKLCSEALDPSVINNSGILLEVDKAAKNEKNYEQLTLLLQLFSSLLSVSKRARAHQGHNQRNPNKLITTKIFQRVLCGFMIDHSQNISSLVLPLQQLTDLYLLLPFQSNEFEVGRATFVVKTHTIVEAEVVYKLICRAQQLPAIREVCCQLVSAFFVPILVGHPKPSVGLRNLAAQLMHSLCKLIQVCLENEKVFLTAMYSCLLLSHACEKQKLVQTNLDLAKNGLEALKRYGDNLGLKLLVCLCFESMYLDEYNMSTLLGRDIFHNLTSLIADNSPTVALRACQTIFSIFSKYPQSAKHSVNSEIFASALIFSLEKHKFTSEIVEYIAFFASFFFASAKWRYRRIFADSGGLPAIINCLGAKRKEIEVETHRSLNRILLETIPSTDMELLFVHRVSVTCILIDSLESSLDNKNSLIQILQLMLGLCDHNGNVFSFIFAAAVPVLRKVATTHFREGEISLCTMRLLLAIVAADENLSLSTECHRPLNQLLDSLILATPDSGELVAAMLDILRLLGTEGSLNGRGVDKKAECRRSCCLTEPSKRPSERAVSGFAVLSDAISSTKLEIHFSLSDESQF